MTERMSKWHRRDERQKETTDAYRDGWERIFAKPATIEPPCGGKHGGDLIDAPAGTHTANPEATPEGEEMTQRERLIKRGVVLRMALHKHLDRGLEYEEAYARALDAVMEMLGTGEL